MQTSVVQAAEPCSALRMVETRCECCTCADSNQGSDYLHTSCTMNWCLLQRCVGRNAVNQGSGFKGRLHPFLLSDGRQALGPHTRNCDLYLANLRPVNHINHDLTRSLRCCTYDLACSVCLLVLLMCLWPILPLCDCPFL